MEITRNGTSPSTAGPAAYFTGTVRLDTPFKAEAPGRAGGAVVTFEPGARTAWHTHPLGQTVIVTSGLGWAQREGGPVEEVPAGRKALARRHRPDRHDPCGHRRIAGRHAGDLAGTGDGRTVSRQRLAQARG